MRTTITMILLGCALLGATRLAAAEPGEEAKAVFKGYEEVFNSRDAARAAALWTADAVYVDGETGERIEGRAAIEADLKRIFESHPTLKISFQVESARLVAEAVAIAEGRSKALEEWEPAYHSAFSAVLVKQDGKWLISNVQEIEAPTPANASEGLKELAWLVGKWKDEGGEDKVETEVRWGVGGSFLVRSFRGAGPEGGVASSQIIGWDPTDGSIRSWTFDAEGSFGEESWEKTEDGWLVRIARTLADGREATGAQIIKKTSDDEFTIRMVSAEIDGEMIPPGEAVKVVRVAAAESK